MAEERGKLPDIGSPSHMVNMHKAHLGSIYSNGKWWLDGILKALNFNTR